jgi:hypothetical protein
MPSLEKAFKICTKNKVLRSDEFDDINELRLRIHAYNYEDLTRGRSKELKEIVTIISNEGGMVALVQDKSTDDPAVLYPIDLKRVGNIQQVATEETKKNKEKRFEDYYKFHQYGDVNLASITFVDGFLRDDLRAIEFLKHELQDDPKCSEELEVEIRTFMSGQDVKEWSCEKDPKNPSTVTCDVDIG